MLVYSTFLNRTERVKSTEMGKEEGFDPSLQWFCQWVNVFAEQGNWQENMTGITNLI
jgi:hypothetical protein